MGISCVLHESLVMFGVDALGVLVAIMAVILVLPKNLALWKLQLLLL